MSDLQMSESYYRPFSQEDYALAVVAYSNMVQMKILTDADRRRLLKILKAAVRE
jgi:hypothetical protein